MTVIKTADPRPAYNAVANALKELKAEQAAVREAIDRTAGALQTAVGGIDGKIEQVERDVAALETALKSTESLVRGFQGDMAKGLKDLAQEGRQRQAELGRVLEGLAAQQSTIRWIAIGATVFSGLAMLGMVMLLLR